MASNPWNWVSLWKMPTGPRVWSSLMLIFICLSHNTIASDGISSGPVIPPLRSSNTPLLDQVVGDASQLECLEVVPPVIAPAPSVPACFQTLMQHSFESSYGKPFVGQYRPPDCQFNQVVINFTVTAAGRQFDRLALMFLGDVEVFRTSTAEPTAAPGIIWAYEKDMSAYLSLWKQPQTLIFDLGNTVNENYTAPFVTTLTAIFFNDNQTNAATPADIIIPVSARKSAMGGSSEFRVPDAKALNTLTIPQNAERAVFSISACGQMAEEFWWSNVPDSTASTFGNNSLLGHSPFREVQLLIDGQLTGVAWPFPVIFTGGVVPGFWRPVVGIDAFDLREDEVDITPWLPALSDGKDHTYEIRVMGLTDDGLGNAVLSSIGSYWVVTGKIFLWLDGANSTTSGPAPTTAVADPQFFVTSAADGSGNAANTTLNYQVLAQRQLAISNTITTSEGEKQVSWTQTLSYSNVGNFVSDGNNQTNTMMISGTDVSSSGYSRKFAYPLDVFNAINLNATTGAMSIDGNMDRSKNEQIVGNSVFPSPLGAYNSQGPFDGFTITNRQNGTAFYFADPSQGISGGSGATEQDFVLKGILNDKTKAPQGPLGGSGIELFSRHVLAANNSVVADSGPGALPNRVFSLSSGNYDFVMSDFAMVSARNIVGGKVVRRADD